MRYNIHLHGITQSKLTQWLQCRQKAAYGRLNVGYPDGKEREALWFGSMMHWLLEQFHSGDDTVDIEDWMRFQNNENLSDKSMFRPCHANQQESNMIYVGGVLFEGYKKFYKKTNSKRVYTSLEEEFCIPYYPGGDYPVVYLRGKRDGLGYAKADKSKWLFETKTLTRHDEDTKLSLLQFDFQALYYIMCTEMEREVKLRGVWYNMIRKPGHKQGAKQSVEVFRERVRKEIEKDPGHFFYQYEVAYLPSQKAAFREQFNSIIREYLDWWNGEISTYKNTSACKSPYNCPYIEACARKNNPSAVYGMDELERVHPELSEDLLPHAKAKTNTAGRIKAIRRQEKIKPSRRIDAP